MKYHIVFKFLALLLCALTLLGAVGSVVAIAVLTTTDLYNKSVDQLIEENIREQSAWLAENKVQLYTNTTLGQCPQDLWNQSYGSITLDSLVTSPETSTGYAIFDQDGQELTGENQQLRQSATVYTFPASGRYMHLVSTEPVAETGPVTEPVEEPALLEAPSFSEMPLGEESGVYDMIPYEGAQITGVRVSYADPAVGNVSLGSSDTIGYLFRNDLGQVICQLNGKDLLDTGEVLQIAFFQTADGTVVYQAGGEEPVGQISRGSDDNLIYFSMLQEPVPSETVEETAPAETGDPADAAEASPEQEVYSALFYNRNDEQVWEKYSTEPIGYLYYDATGCLTFVSYVSGDDFSGDIELPATVYRVVLFDTDEERIYDASDADGIGVAFAGKNGNMQYRSFYPDAGQTAQSEEPVETSSGSAPADQQDAQPPQSDDGQADGQEQIDSTETTAVVEQIDSTEATAVVEQTVPETNPIEAAPTDPEPTVQEADDPVLINGRPLSEYALHTLTYYDSDTEQQMEASYVYVPMPEYTVEVYIDTSDLRFASAYDVLRFVRAYRTDLFLFLGVCLLLFAVLAVYLCCAAGHTPKSDAIQAGGLNRLPLDLYAALACGGIACICIVLMEGTAAVLQKSLQTGCVFALGLGYAASLLLVSFGFALTAQIKTPGGYWWRGSVCGRLLVGCIRFCRWLEKFLFTRLLPWIGKCLKVMWRWLAVQAGRVLALLNKLLRRLGDGIRNLISLLPLIWQWLLAGILVLILILLALNTSSFLFTMVCLAGAIGILAYGAYAFGILLKSAKNMHSGDLDTPVDRKHLVGCFSSFAQELDGLAGVAVVAAQKQLKSERMKTELITNVSHDIKTPLTSIINYVDLLQRPHTDDEQQMYLEVLDRQSQQLKKLIEDLMDMSKASTGNMPVEVMPLNAVESVNQALGEFADKLEKAQIQPVFRHSDEAVEMTADGRLVWRVLSNLLSNAVKYAMPGTRLYIDLERLDGKVIISMKNISRDELNIDADELIERFVRGDGSRNTEGSGLGLNISKSLMELQKGQLQLLVDGDLFKVTLIFPGTAK